MKARRDPYLPALALIVIVAVGVRCFLLTAHATEEDFFITLRYAQNIAHGLGFVYNPGAHVLGATTPLYTLILALLIRLHLDPIFWAKLLGIAADAVTCIAVYRLGRALQHPGAGLAAALCVALLSVNLIWATKGMEVELVAAAGAVAWAAWAEEREIVAWVAAAILALLRIDGVVLAVFLLLGTLFWERQLPWRGLLLFTLVQLPWLIFATLYFGSPVPVSVTAKLHVYAHSPTSRFPRLGEFLALMSHNVGLMLLLGCALALAALIYYLQLRRSKSGLPAPPELRLVPSGLWILSYYASMAFSPVFLFGWYFVPPTPLYYLIAMTGWSILLGCIWKDLFRWAANDRLSRAGNVLQKPVMSVALVMVAALLLAGVFVPRALRDLRSGQASEQTLRIPIGQWLHDHALPTDTVMLEPIGYIGYFGGTRILDVVGLVSPEVLPMWDRQVPSPEHAIWWRYRPDWILLRAGEWGDMQKREAALLPSEHLTAHYDLVRQWPELPAPGAFYLFRRKEKTGSGTGV